MVKPSTPPPKGSTPRPTWMLWLGRVNTVLSQWAANQSWGRMVVLALVVLIAGSWIGETLNLRHEKIDADDKPAVARPTLSKASGPCIGDEIRIGGDRGIVICDKGRGSRAADSPAEVASAPPPPPISHDATEAAAPSAGAASPAVPALPTSAASAVKSRATIVIDSDDDADVDDDTRSPSAKVVIQRTFAGWLGDIFSALLIALFAYLVAAKIMVRKTAEANAKLHVADAKVRSAEDNAEREAVQRQLMQAQLKLLQAQVEPHFLFNTLAAVDYLIETDPPRASVMQKTLIAYLRASLPQMRQESSTLGRELQLIRAYLALLKMRIEERLEFDIEVSPELEGAVFPPMVLQTLVENAIQHGIEPKPGGGRISVRALQEGGNLRVDVVDTGVGLPSNYNGGNPQPSANGGSGLGLDNIRNRLAVLYPHTSRIELSSGYGGGTLVRLTIPYQNANAADAGTTP